MEEIIIPEIQAVVSKYAKVISHVIKIEVEIVDARLFRIAGTGRYRNNSPINLVGIVITLKEIF